VAEEANKPEEQQEQPKKKLPIKAILIIAAITMVELGGFTALYYLTSTEEAGAGTQTDLPQGTVDTISERLIMRVRAVNTKTGKRVFHELEVAVWCDKDDEEAIEGIQKKRELYLRDQLRTIISAAHPQFFDEEKMQTIKRQIGAVLVEVFGEDRIKKVLISDYSTYSGDF
jgi:flagellar basal body-associated protein FliL